MACAFFVPMLYWQWRETKKHISSFFVTLVVTTKVTSHNFWVSWTIFDCESKNLTHKSQIINWNPVHIFNILFP